MMTETLEVRDIPGTDVAVLRKRASPSKMSLSAYVRELIREEAARLDMEEALTKIGARERIPAEGEHVRSYIEAGHR